MKVCILIASLVSVAMSEAQVPAAQTPPAGWRPSGRLLLLPARLENPPPAEYPTTTQPHANATQESDESQSEKILDSGEYYVLLSDGRLQMVKYSTAALKEESKTPSNTFQQQQQQQQQSSFQQQSSNYRVPTPVRNFQPQYFQEQQSSFQQGQQQQSFQSSQYTSPFPAGSSNVQQFQQVKQAEAQPSPFAQFQVEYVQFPLPGSQFTQTKLQYAEETQDKAEEKEEDSEDVTGFQANVQYRDVKPISAPIYAYNPTPLVRILKK